MSVNEDLSLPCKTPTTLSNAPPRLALRSTPYGAPDPSNGKGPKAYMYKGRPRESVDRGAHPYIAHFLYHFLYIAHTPLCYLQVTSINQYLPLVRRLPTSLSNAPPRLALRSTPYVAPDPSNGKGPKGYMYTHRSIGRPRLVRESQTREWWSYVVHKGRPRERVDRGAHPYIAHFLYQRRYATYKLRP
jgi:hypothetical protein